MSNLTDNARHLLQNAAAVGAGPALRNVAGRKTFQARGTCADAGSATIQIQGSNDKVNWDLVETLTLAALAPASTSISADNDGRHTWLRANVSAISGTTPSVSVTVGH